VSEFERGLILIPVIDEIIFLLENLESELVLLSGTVGETLSFHMSREFLMELGWSFLLEEALETE